MLKGSYAHRVQSYPMWDMLYIHFIKSLKQKKLDQETWLCWTHFYDFVDDPWTIKH